MFDFTLWHILVHDPSKTLYINFFLFQEFNEKFTTIHFSCLFAVTQQNLVAVLH